MHAATRFLPPLCYAHVHTSAKVVEEEDETVSKVLPQEPHVLVYTFGLCAFRGRV